MYRDKASDRLKDEQRQWKRRQKHIKKVNKKREQLKFRKKSW